MMKANEMIAVVTGATGGLGQAFCRRLVFSGATVVMVGRNQQSLEAEAILLKSNPKVIASQVHYFVADLVQSVDRNGLLAFIESLAVEVNCLINNAGVNHFGLFASLSEEELEEIMTINALVPMQLTQLLLPTFLAQKNTMVVNVGSIFGSLAYPSYSAYSASKFALRGFSEALSRELADTGVAVKYLAPRAVETDFHSEGATALNKALKTPMDSPEKVADCLLKLMQGNRRELLIGWPEKLFARINQCLPDVVSRSLKKELAVIKQYAK